MNSADRIATFIATMNVKEGSAITGKTSLLDSGIIDSMGILDVVMFLEGEFGIRVQDEEIIPDNFETVDQIAALVESKTKR